MEVSGQLHAPDLHGGKPWTVLPNYGMIRTVSTNLFNLPLSSLIIFSFILFSFIILLRIMGSLFHHALGCEVFVFTHEQVARFPWNLV
jgi:hypothetical protein